METHEYHCISQLNAGTAGTLEVLGTELYKLAVSTAAGGPLLPSVRRESGQSIPSVTVTPVAALPVVAFMARRITLDSRRSAIDPAPITVVGIDRPRVGMDVR
jgi:hypothetical protein